MRGQKYGEAKASCASPELPMRQLIMPTSGSEIDITSSTGQSPGQMYSMYKKQLEKAATTRFRQALKSSSPVSLQPCHLGKPPAPDPEDFVDNSAERESALDLGAAQVLYWDTEKRLDVLDRELEEEAILSGRRGSKEAASRAEALPSRHRESFQIRQGAFQRTMNGVLDPDKDNEVASGYVFARGPVPSPVSGRGCKHTMIGAGEAILSSRRGSKESTGTAGEPRWPTDEAPPYNRRGSGSKETAGTANVVPESRRISQAAVDTAEALPSDLCFPVRMSRRSQVLVADRIPLWQEGSQEMISPTQERPVFRP